MAVDAILCPRHGEPASEADTRAAAITKLPPFDRFVYVMSVVIRQNYVQPRNQQLAHFPQPANLL
jgi:hypothetical protein